VEVTIQSYRHRYRNAPGDPAYDEIELQLAAQLRITVPTITLQGEADGVQPAETSAGHARFFSGAYERRVLPRVGHNPPAEAPGGFARAILDLMDRAEL